LANGFTYLEVFDIKAGGEDMKIFYDKILAGFMNELGKNKWVQVKDIKIRAEEKSGTILSLPFMGSDGTMRQETTYSLTLQRLLRTRETIPDLMKLDDRM